MRQAALPAGVAAGGVEHLFDLLAHARLGFLGHQVADRFGQGLEHIAARVERGIGVLEHHLHVARGSACAGLVHGVDALAPE